MNTDKQNDDFFKVVSPRGSWNFLEEAIKWISENMKPEDVFSNSNLVEWASKNEYVRPTIGVTID